MRALSVFVYNGVQPGLLKSTVFWQYVWQYTGCVKKGYRHNIGGVRIKRQFWWRKTGRLYYLHGFSRNIMKLTDINIKKTKPREKTYKLFDGGGLYVQIEPIRLIFSCQCTTFATLLFNLADASVHFQRRWCSTPNDASVQLKRHMHNPALFLVFYSHKYLNLVKLRWRATGRKIGLSIFLCGR